MIQQSTVKVESLGKTPFLIGPGTGSARWSVMRVLGGKTGWIGGMVGPNARGREPGWSAGGPDLVVMKLCER